MTLDVTPPFTTTYTLSSTGGALGTATVDVICAGPGTPLPESPANGAALPAGTATLSWAPATGATSYDVYADGNAQPTTLVASALTGTSVDVPGIAPNAHYAWQVVARSTGCPTPTPSPVFTFDTCDGGVCEFVDHFDGTELAGWTTSGRGSARIVGGRLQVKGKRRLTLVPPAPAAGDGSLALVLDLQRGRRELRVLFHYRDARNYAELDVRGRGGKLRLIEHASGQPPRTLAKTNTALPPGTLLELRLAGAAAHVLVNGVEVLAATLASTDPGTFALQAVSSSLAIDDVVIRAH
jgi:hypothetical protein